MKKLILSELATAANAINNNFTAICAAFVFAAPVVFFVLCALSGENFIP